jgi:hypothetical protein
MPTTTQKQDTKEGQFLELLTTSAPRQATSFGGQYHQLLEMPSDVGTWNMVSSPDLGTWGFEASVTTSTYQFSFTSANDDVTNVKRALGGMIMAALPAEALDHVLASLRDYYLFYLEDQEIETVGGDLVVTAGTGTGHGSGLAVGYNVAR